MVRALGVDRRLKRLLFEWGRDEMELTREGREFFRAWVELEHAVEALEAARDHLAAALSRRDELCRRVDEVADEVRDLIEELRRVGDENEDEFFEDWWEEDYSEPITPEAEWGEYDDLEIELEDWEDDEGWWE